MKLSFVFVCYSLAMSIISWGYSKVTSFTILRNSLFILYISILGSIFYILISTLNNFIYSLFFFALSFGVINLVQIAVSVLIQKKLKQENRIVITKYISFFSRIGMITSLFILHQLFANGWSINEVYKLYGAFAMLISCICFCWVKMQNKFEGTYVKEYSN
jgi:hypothetical protein